MGTEKKCPLLGGVCYIEGNLEGFLRGVRYMVSAIERFDCMPNSQLGRTINYKYFVRRN